MTAPISMVMLPWREDIPRGGVNREQAVVTLATTLYSLNHVENTGFVQLAQAPTLAAGGNFVIGGWKSVGTAATWDLTGQPDVPPFRKIVYLLLVNDRTVPPTPAGPFVYAAVPTELNEPAQRWAPNGPEAFIKALNRDTGYAIAGFLEITNNTPNPWTPGTAFPAAPFAAAVVSGFPGDMLLPFSIPPGTSPGFFAR